ncbi:MAG: hypothetical protein RL497_178, partial [Pseudomonadota bacterium]
MRGQWLGRYDGSTNGKIMINVDDVDDHYEGVAYLHPDDSSIPGTVAYFSTRNKKKHHSTKVSTYPIDPRNGFQTTWDEIKQLFPNSSHSEKADATFNVIGDKMHVEAKTNIGVEFSADLTRPASNATTKIEGEEMSWSQFREYVATFSESGYLFRGQQQPWPLCTTFHRRGRYRISEFTSKDVRQLHQRLSAITKHYFDLSVPDQNGAFFNLLQHHGYPTPLLDWSHSPFVAA